jgi:hypothetical protein
MWGVGSLTILYELAILYVGNEIMIGHQEWYERK